MDMVTKQRIIKELKDLELEADSLACNKWESEGVTRLAKTVREVTKLVKIAIDLDG